MNSAYPKLRAVADTGVLVEFGDVIDDDIHSQVINFDATISNANIKGFTESSPAFTCVLVGYDALLTDYEIMCEQIEKYLNTSKAVLIDPKTWEVPTCYAESLAPDLAELAQTLGMTTDAIAEQHSSGQYKVYMYGFAPGYAYLGGVPESIQVPRKQAPVMNVPPQTVMIAGQQALITTLPMPTGWWRIGMTTFQPLQKHRDKPFVLNVGDTVKFIAMNEADYKKFSAQPNER